MARILFRLKYDRNWLWVPCEGVSLTAPCLYAEIGKKLAIDPSQLRLENTVNANTPIPCDPGVHVPRFSRVTVRLCRPKPPTFRHTQSRYFKRSVQTHVGKRKSSWTDSLPPVPGVPKACAEDPAESRATSSDEGLGHDETGSGKRQHVETLESASVSTICDKDKNEVRTKLSHKSTPASLLCPTCDTLLQDPVYLPGQSTSVCRACVPSGCLEEDIVCARQLHGLVDTFLSGLVLMSRHPELLSSYKDDGHEKAGASLSDLLLHVQFHSYWACQVQGAMSCEENK